MKILFVHQNFPAQFGQLVKQLAKQPDYELLALMQPPGRKVEDVGVVPYKFLNTPADHSHPLLGEMEAKVLRAEAVAEAAYRLKAKGWSPDVIIGHPGWGELLFVRDIWPTARLVVYCEYYYRAEGQDLNFDTEFEAADIRLIQRMKLKNTVMLTALADADVAYTPTEWQRQTFPEHLRDSIHVIHDGIDTEYYKPNPDASFQIANKGITLSQGDEVITYAARSLEPVRGFHQFMRLLPEILSQRPNAHVVIMGAKEASYGPEPIDFNNWQDRALAELGHQLDPQRVHFTGFLSREQYQQVLQVSKVHVYMTYPFLLSWSMLEAMSCGALVIGSDTGPVRDVIEHNKNGLLVPFFDTKAWVKTIVKELKAKKNSPLREKSWQFIQENYAYSDCIRKLQNLYQNQKL
jgi:glycosyltransferase involved in cell wall biosynthesis